MHETLELIATVLTRRGLKSSYKRHGDYTNDGTLTVDGTPIRTGRTTARSARTVYQIWIDGVGRYTNYKHGGYKVVEMIADIITSLPQIQERAKEKERAKQQADYLAEIQKAHAGDPRIRTIWQDYQGYYRFEFRTEDPILFQVTLDKVREVEYLDDTPKEVVQTNGAKRSFDFVDDDNEPLESRSFTGVVARFSCEDLDETDYIDQLDAMIVGELRVLGEHRIIRTA